MDALASSVAVVTDSRIRVPSSIAQLVIELLLAARILQASYAFLRDETGMTQFDTVDVYGWTLGTRIDMLLKAGHQHIAWAIAMGVALASMLDAMLPIATRYIAALRSAAGQGRLGAQVRRALRGNAWEDCSTAATDDEATGHQHWLGSEASKRAASTMLWNWAAVLPICQSVLARGPTLASSQRISSEAAVAGIVVACLTVPVQWLWQFIRVASMREALAVMHEPGGAIHFASFVLEPHTHRQCCVVLTALIFVGNLAVGTSAAPYFAAAMGAWLLWLWARVLRWQPYCWAGLNIAMNACVFAAACSMWLAVLAALSEAAGAQLQLSAWRTSVMVCMVAAAAAGAAASYVRTARVAVLRVAHLAKQLADEQRPSASMLADGLLWARIAVLRSGRAMLHCLDPLTTTKLWGSAGIGAAIESVSKEQVVRDVWQLLQPLAAVDLRQMQDNATSLRTSVDDLLYCVHLVVQGGASLEQLAEVYTRATKREGAAAQHRFDLTYSPQDDSTWYTKADSTALASSELLDDQSTQLHALCSAAVQFLQCARVLQLYQARMFDTGSQLPLPVVWGLVSFSGVPLLNGMPEQSEALAMSRAMPQLMAQPHMRMLLWCRLTHDEAERQDTTAHTLYTKLASWVHRKCSAAVGQQQDHSAVESAKDLVHSLGGLHTGDHAALGQARAGLELNLALAERNRERALRAVEAVWQHLWSQGNMSVTDSLRQADIIARSRRAAEMHYIASIALQLGYGCVDDNVIRRLSSFMQTASHDEVCQQVVLSLAQRHGEQLGADVVQARGLGKLEPDEAPTARHQTGMGWWHVLASLACPAQLLVPQAVVASKADHILRIASMALHAEQLPRACKPVPFHRPDALSTAWGLLLVSLQEDETWGTVQFSDHIAARILYGSHTANAAAVGHPLHEYLPSPWCDVLTHRSCARMFARLLIVAPHSVLHRQLVVPIIDQDNNLQLVRVVLELAPSALVWTHRQPVLQPRMAVFMQHVEVGPMSQRGGPVELAIAQGVQHRAPRVSACTARLRDACQAPAMFSQRSDWLWHQLPAAAKATQQVCDPYTPALAAMFALDGAHSAGDSSTSVPGEAEAGPLDPFIVASSSLTAASLNELSVSTAPPDSKHPAMPGTTGAARQAWTSCQVCAVVHQVPSPQNMLQMLAELADMGTEDELNAHEPGWAFIMFHSMPHDDPNLADMLRAVPGTPAGPSIAGTSTSDLTLTIPLPQWHDDPDNCVQIGLAQPAEWAQAAGRGFAAAHAKPAAAPATVAAAAAAAGTSAGGGQLQPSQLHSVNSLLRVALDQLDPMKLPQLRWLANNYGILLIIGVIAGSVALLSSSLVFFPNDEIASSKLFQVAQAHSALANVWDAASMSGLPSFIAISPLLPSSYARVIYNSTISASVITAGGLAWDNKLASTAALSPQVSRGYWQRVSPSLAANATRAALDGAGTHTLCHACSLGSKVLSLEARALVLHRAAMQQLQARGQCSTLGLLAQGAVAHNDSQLLHAVQQKLQPAPWLAAQDPLAAQLGCAPLVPSTTNRSVALAAVTAVGPAVVLQVMPEFAMATADLRDTISSVLEYNVGNTATTTLPGLVVVGLVTIGFCIPACVGLIRTRYRPTQALLRMPRAAVRAALRLSKEWKAQGGEGGEAISPTFDAGRDPAMMSARSGFSRQHSSQQHESLQRLSSSHSQHNLGMPGEKSPLSAHANAVAGHYSALAQDQQGKGTLSAVVAGAAAKRGGGARGGGAGNSSSRCLGGVFAARLIFALSALNVVGICLFLVPFVVYQLYYSEGLGHAFRRGLATYQLRTAALEMDVCLATALHTTHATALAGLDPAAFAGMQVIRDKVNQLLAGGVLDGMPNYSAWNGAYRPVTTELQPLSEGEPMFTALRGDACAVSASMYQPSVTSWNWSTTPQLVASASQPEWEAHTINCSGYNNGVLSRGLAAALPLYAEQVVSTIRSLAAQAPAAASNGTSPVLLRTLAQLPSADALALAGQLHATLQMGMHMRAALTLAAKAQFAHDFDAQQAWATAQLLSVLGAIGLFLVCYLVAKGGIGRIVGRPVVYAQELLLIMPPDELDVNPAAASQINLLVLAAMGLASDEADQSMENMSRTSRRSSVLLARGSARGSVSGNSVTRSRAGSGQKPKLSVTLMRARTARNVLA